MITPPSLNLRSSIPLFILLAFTVPACAQRGDDPAFAAKPERSEGGIDQSRQNAITRAVKACSPAVVFATCPAPTALPASSPAPARTTRSPLVSSSK